jgi:Raf kinase inhibitor-like YbhB/YbcL family protein
MAKPAHTPKKSRSAVGQASTRPKSKGPDLRLESPSFGRDERIPTDFTADGQNLSPALTWRDPPMEARALALVCEDPDAPGPDPFVHWLVTDIEPAKAGTMLGQGAQAIPGAVLGRNSFGRIGYSGPEPPRGHGIHHYHFKLYALGSPLRLREGFSKEDLVKAMKGHILAAGELVGTYSR